jgi:glycosyltransferase involved in cell wall biosynthesis
MARTETDRARPTIATDSVSSSAARSRPLVSVCVSAYNVDPYLREALDSILGQTYAHLEVIVVDNGSGDETFAIMSSIRDDRFRCFRLPENIGGYQAMNMVWQLAAGDLIAIYHSDDVYEPTIVEREVEYLESHPETGAVFTMCKFIDETGAIVGGLDVPAELVGLEQVRFQDVFPVMLRRGNIMFTCPSFMARRNVLHEVGPFDADRWDIAADQELWLRLTSRYPVGILGERLFRYRQTSQQWTRRWKRLRSEPDRSLDVMQLYLEKGDFHERLPYGQLELRSLRCDDETTRSANAVLRGEIAEARRLLHGRYPYRALAHNLRRRKLRVLALRALMKTFLACRAGGALARVLRRVQSRE